MSDILFMMQPGVNILKWQKWKMQKGENSIKHLSLYKYGYFKPCYTIPKSSAEGVFMAYNDDNDLLFTIREYEGDIVKIEVATKTEYYRYIARN